MKTIKSVKHSEVMEEAELVFEKFVLLRDIGGASVRSDEKHDNKVEKKADSRKNIFEKFRNSFKRNKSAKSKKRNKENKNCCETKIVAGAKQNDKVVRDGNHKTSSKFTKVLVQEGNEERSWKSSPGRKSPPTFWLIEPPPPVPSPTFLNYRRSSGVEFDGEEPVSQLEEFEDDTDDVDGESDKFEDLSDEEKQKRVEEVSRMLDKIVEDQFGPAIENTILRSSSSASISSLSQHLVSDLSYKFFKAEVNSFVRSHNDKLLNQIVLLFSIARSAIKKVGLRTSEGQEVTRNTMKFYEDAYMPLVSEAGGLENLLKSETERR